MRRCIAPLPRRSRPPTERPQRRLRVMRSLRRLLSFAKGAEYGRSHQVVRNSCLHNAFRRYDLFGRNRPVMEAEEKDCPEKRNFPAEAIFFVLRVRHDLTLCACPAGAVPSGRDGAAGREPRSWHTHHVGNHNDRICLHNLVLSVAHCPREKGIYMLFFAADADLPRYGSALQSLQQSFPRLPREKVSVQRDV